MRTCAAAAAVAAVAAGASITAAAATHEPATATLPTQPSAAPTFTLPSAAEPLATAFLHLRRDMQLQLGRRVRRRRPRG